MQLKTVGKIAHFSLYSLSLLLNKAQQELNLKYFNNITDLLRWDVSQIPLNPVYLNKLSLRFLFMLKFKNSLPKVLDFQCFLSSGKLIKIAKEMC
jgi:hypothetical protein